MGLWITGYAEFAYDRPGSDNNWTDAYPPKQGPIPFPCAICGKTFTSLDEVMRHRFETHPMKRPALFLRGKEASSTRVVLSSVLAPSEVHCADAESAILNGRPVNIGSLPAELTHRQKGLKEIVLVSSGAINARYEIQFEIADPGEIAAVDKTFFALLRPDEIDVERIALFARETNVYRSATRYVDGLAQYLYGVLAKERRGGTHIPFEQYRERFNLALAGLTGFDTPLAEAAAGVISFSMNTFEKHGSLRYSYRLGRSMKWFADAISCVRLAVGKIKEDIDRGIVEIPIDAASDALICWSEELIRNGGLEEENLVSRCAGDAKWAADDRLKAVILLAEHYRGSGRLKEARNYARPFTDHALYGKWAASFSTKD